ncbi:MAG: Rrf2 family transcriptional regulator [bacterium]|nr:Rrf2 family transcriptional regulator [bacterium]
MRITAVEEYGLRCLLTLARSGPSKQMSISEIAGLEGLSVPYVSKLLALLRKAGLVTAVRGCGGGFSLARDPKEISLYEVLKGLGGPLIDPGHCERYAGQLDQCVHHENCSVHDVLGGLAGYVREFLADTSLEDLALGHTRGFVRRVGSEVTISRGTPSKNVKIITDKIDEKSIQ